MSGEEINMDDNEQIDEQLIDEQPKDPWVEWRPWILEAAKDRRRDDEQRAAEYLAADKLNDIDRWQVERGFMIRTLKEALIVAAPRDQAAIVKQLRELGGY